MTWRHRFETWATYLVGTIGGTAVLLVLFPELPIWQAAVASFGALLFCDTVATVSRIGNM